MAYGEANNKKKVVIVGGGPAGGLLAKTIQFQADVVLIDQKEYFEITWAAIRAKVEPPIAEKTTFKHSDYFSNGRIVIASAVGITETQQVLTSDGQQIPYDYLVIATGQDNYFPKSRSKRIEEFEAEHDKIKSADSILIIGGGPAGVELAGEIVVDFPEKKVTLVHSKSRLLNYIGPKASRKALDWLISKKVEVILDQRVNLDGHCDGDKTYQTSGGQSIRADCHFLCVGRSFNSSWIKESFLKNAVDSRGRVMVDEHLRVKGCNNVFAIGDINDVPELNQSYLAMAHATFTAKNLKLLMNGGKESKLRKYKPGSEMAIVSLGRKEGVAQFPFGTIIGWFPGMIKHDMFVGKTRKLMGLN